VSRALSEETRRQVNVDTVRRVMAAAEELGYQPDLTARTLRTGRTATVGVMVPDLTNPLFPPILRGIEDCLAEGGYTALLANTDNDLERERRILPALRARNVEGFILLTTHRNDEALAALLRDGIPVVTVNRVATEPDVSSVRADDDAGIAAIVDHLAELGHTRIASIAGPRSLSTGSARARALATGLRKHGLPPATVVQARAFSEAEGSRCMEELLDDPEAAGVTAVVAGNDMLALGAMDVLRQRGLRVPADLSVTGFNDMRFMDRLNPPLTTVRIPQYDMGFAAARLLLDRLAGRTTATQHVVMPVSLVVRESTAAPRS
jgi:LacI family transcriptional regulator